MKLDVGDVVKINGQLREILKSTPHQDMPGTVYFDLGDGYVERDIRLHPEAVYRRVDTETEHPISCTGPYEQHDDSAMYNLIKKLLDDAMGHLLERLDRVMSTPQESDIRMQEIRDIVLEWRGLSIPETVGK